MRILVAFFTLFGCILFLSCTKDNLNYYSDVEGAWTVSRINFSNASGIQSITPEYELVFNNCYTEENRGELANPWCEGLQISLDGSRTIFEFKCSGSRSNELFLNVRSPAGYYDQEDGSILFGSAHVYSASMPSRNRLVLFTEGNIYGHDAVKNLEYHLLR